jgi:hypothetical protein
MVGGYPQAIRTGEDDMEERKNETIPESRRVVRPLASSMALAAGLMRLIRFAPNFAPVGALGLFGGARLHSWQAVALPLGVMAVTDFLLRALYGLMPFDPFVYVSFLVYVLLGWLLCRTNSAWRIGLASVLGSVQFFLITNFGTWLMTGIYPRTLEGLVTCYTAALLFMDRSLFIPLGFFGNTLMSDLFFTAVLFGVYALLTRKAGAAEVATRHAPVYGSRPELVSERET